MRLLSPKPTATDFLRDLLRSPREKQARLRDVPLAIEQLRLDVSRAPIAESDGSVPARYEACEDVVLVMGQRDFGPEGPVILVSRLRHERMLRRRGLGGVNKVQTALRSDPAYVTDFATTSESVRALSMSR